MKEVGEHFKNAVGKKNGIYIYILREEEPQGRPKLRYCIWICASYLLENFPSITRTGMN